MSDLTDKAVRDALSIAELARDAVKNEIIRNLEPGVNALVERALRENSLGNGTKRTLTEGDDKMADGTELDLESIAGMFAGVNEVEDVAEAADEEMAEGAVDEAEVPYLDEMDSLEGDLDEGEEIEIDESALEEQVKNALKLEVQMSKGFKDLDLSGKEEVDQGNAVHDVKSGESYFNDVEPPAKKDWTVKEVKALIRQGIAENKALAQENARLKAQNSKLNENLKKLNLFNSKMLHVQKIFAEHNLSMKQKKTVVESIDAAKTVSEAVNIAKTLERAFKSSGAKLNESKAQKPKANAARVRTPGADQKVIRESVDKSDNGDQYSRWHTLAGLVK